MSALYPIAKSPQRKGTTGAYPAPRCNKSGSLAKFAASRRASSRVSSVLTEWRGAIPCEIQPVTGVRHEVDRGDPAWFGYSERVSFSVASYCSVGCWSEPQPGNRASYGLLGTCLRLGACVYLRAGMIQLRGGLAPLPSVDAP